MRTLGQRLWRAARRWPDARGWLETAVVGVVTLGIMAAIGFPSGLYQLGPAKTDGLALRLVTVLFIPAIGEEGFFRGLLVPGRDESADPWYAIAWTTIVYTSWHFLEAFTFLPAAAPVFLRPEFIAATSVLGFGCGVIRWRTSSLWPPVALHWAMVVIWQTWLGGFEL